MKTLIVAGILFLAGLTSANAVLPPESVYQQETTWMDSEARPFKLKDLAGVPTIIAMTYTGCQYSCPLTFKKLSAIEKDLKSKGISNYRLVVASFDFQKDTPPVIKAFMKKNKYDPARWSFITAKSDADVRQLAVLLGIRYQKVDDTDFSHSNEISLLDKNGVPALVLKGVSSEHDELVKILASYENK